MNLQDAVTEIIQRAASEASRGAGEIPKTVYDRAAELFGAHADLNELSKGLGLNCTEFLAEASTALGMLEGLQQRLKAEMHKEHGASLAQSAAFTMVDLHGRWLGIESMVHQVVGIIEGARTQRISESSLRARMVGVFVMLEESLAGAAGELVKRGAFSEVASAVDRVAVRVRAQCSGRHQEQLMAHINDLPA